MTILVSRARRLATALLLPLALAACAGGGNRPGDTAYVARDVETLYTEGIVRPASLPGVAIDLAELFEP